MMYTRDELISKAREYSQNKYHSIFPYGNFSFPAEAPVDYATALYQRIAQEYHLCLPDFNFQTAIDEIAKFEQVESRFGACIESKTEGFTSISDLSHSQVVNILSHLEHSKYRLAILADAPIALSESLANVSSALAEKADLSDRIHNEFCIIAGFMSALGDNIAYATNLVIFLLTKMKDLFFLEYEDGYAFSAMVSHVIGECGCFCGFQAVLEDAADVDDIECDGDCAGCSGCDICENADSEEAQGENCCNCMDCSQRDACPASAYLFCSEECESCSFKEHCPDSGSCLFECGDACGECPSRAKCLTCNGKCNDCPDSDECYRQKICAENKCNSDVIKDDDEDELDEVEAEVGERFSTYVAAELRKLPKEETDSIIDIVLFGMYTKLPMLSDRGTALTDMLLITKDSVVKDVFLKFQMP